MVWTKSAPQRGLVVGATPVLEAPPAVAMALRHLGCGDYQKATCAASAAILTFAGLTAQTISPAVMTGFLFLTGAALALLALTGAATSTADVARLQPLSRAATRTALIPELLRPNTPSASVDRAAWTTLAAHMSHELRTPLNAVIGFSELMSQEAFGPLGSGLYTGYARDIHLSGRRLLKTAEDALAITALLTSVEKKSDRATVTLQDPASDAVNFIAPDMIAAGLDFVVSIPEDLCVAADAPSVRQLFINLMSEAVSRASADSRLWLSANRDGDRIVVELNLTLPSSPSQTTAPSFSLTLAATLCELMDTVLSYDELNLQTWRATVKFMPARQRDLFV